MPAETNPTLTYFDIAQALGIWNETVRRLHKSHPHRLSGTVVGNRWRFPAQDLDVFRELVAAERGRKQRTAPASPGLRERIQASGKLTVAEIASAMDLSHNYTALLCRSLDLPHERIGPLRLYDQDAVDILRGHLALRRAQTRERIEVQFRASQGALPITRTAAKLGLSYPTARALLERAGIGGIARDFPASRLYAAEDIERARAYRDVELTLRALNLLAFQLRALGAELRDAGRGDLRLEAETLRRETVKLTRHLAWFLERSRNGRDLPRKASRLGAPR